jgi:hypothetical protein
MSNTSAIALQDLHQNKTDYVYVGLEPKSSNKSFQMPI